MKTNPILSLIVFSILLFFTSALIAQPYLHMGHTYGDYSTYDDIKDICHDRNGNSYVLGEFMGTTDFDPSNKVLNKTSSASSDIFIQKFDSRGRLLWVKVIGNNRSYDYAVGLIIDTNSSIYVICQIKSLTDVNPGSGVHNLNPLNGNQAIVKLDGNGNFLWAKQFGAGNGSAEIENMALDVHGNILLTGQFNNDSIDFDPGVPSYYLPYGSKGFPNVFVLKLGVNGNFKWAKAIGGSSSELTSDIAVDDSLNVYLCGVSTSDSVDFDPDTNSAFFHGRMTWSYILKLDSLGKYKWAQAYTDTRRVNASVWFSTISISKNHVYVGGNFKGQIDFDHGIGTVYMDNSLGNGSILKLNHQGGFESVRRLPGPVYNTDLDPENNLYSIGHFFGTKDFDSDTGSTQMVIGSLSYINVFVHKMDSIDFFEWGSPMGGVGNDYGTQISAYSKDNIWVGGNFTQNIDLAPSSFNYNRSSKGKVDGFYAMLRESCSSLAQYDTLKGCDSVSLYSGGTSWSQTGLYADTLTNKYRCDSIINVYVQISKSSLDTLKTSACNSYLSPSGAHTWATSGIYYDTLQRKSGCDSVLAIDLTVDLSSVDSIKTFSCDSLRSPSGNFVWTNTGIHLDTLTRKSGCDSLFVFDLKIHSSHSKNISDFACDTFWALSNKTFWTQTGKYLDTLSDINGCDSVLTINLNIGQTLSFTDSATSCESYNWVRNNKAYSNSGLYLDTIRNSGKCDSLIALNLTIKRNSSAVINKNSCFSYTSPSGKYFWTQSGTYSDTILNEQGCDSLINVNLVIDTVNNVVFRSGIGLKAIQTNAQYSWLDCSNNYQVVLGEKDQKFEPNVNGLYAVEIDYKSCLDTSMCTSYASVGNRELHLFQDVMIYPNPSQGRVIIDFAEMKCVGLQVFNCKGQVVVERECISSRKIEFSLQISGVYFVKITNEKGHHIYNLVID